MVNTKLERMAFETRSQVARKIIRRQNELR